MRTVALLTDFGTSDYYVAAVKGVLRGAAPHALPVDMSHEVEPGDIAGAAFLLGAARPSYPAGTVFLAVVDPGVGSDRRIVVAERDGQLHVAPDNGLLTPVLEGARVWAVERADLFRDAPGSTFHGRDRFAPVAGWLAGGGDPAALGSAIDDPVRLPVEPPRRAADGIRGRIVHVDRFGNLVSDVPAEWLGTDGGWEARVAGRRCRRLVSHYARLPPGVPGMLVGSLGTIELSLDGASLAAAWGVERGAVIELARLARESARGG